MDSSSQTPSDTGTDKTLIQYNLYHLTNDRYFLQRDDAITEYMTGVIDDFVDDLEREYGELCGLNIDEQRPYISYVMNPNFIMVIVNQF